MKTEKTIELTGQDEALRLCGTYDRYLRLISKTFDVKVSLKGNTLRLKGERKDVEKASESLKKISERLKTESTDLTSEEVLQIIDETQHPIPRHMAGEKGKKMEKSTLVKPRTEGQKRYLEIMETHDIVFSIGPAGTGKTYLGVARAIQCLKTGQVKKIILARPAVEAGERLGFLPGDYKAKVNPYLRPLYDALNSFLPYQQLRRLMDTDIIEVIPLAYMRGRNLEDAFMILDEAQNTTSEQMMMYLTRMGERSRIVVTGDITQIDLPPGKTSGLVAVQSILAHIKGIAFVYLTRADIVRHPLVQSIVDAYEMKSRLTKKHKR